MVLPPTVIVIVELPAPGAGIEFGLKLTVVPDGTPAADRVIELLKPPLMVVVIVELPWFPCYTVTEVGEAEIVKSARRHRQGYRGSSLHSAAIACYRDGIGSDRSTAADGDGHPGSARTRCRNRVGIETYRCAAGTPAAESAIELLKPPLIAVVIVDVP